MVVRTTVDIPQPLHDRLRRRAEASGTSIRALIVTALEQTYAPPSKKKLVIGPLIAAKGKRGPRYPIDETPYDLIFP